MSDMKPLGHKAYGSIPHLPGSKRGPGDHGLEEKQADILVNGRKGWTIVAQEKLDGACVSVAKINGEIVALGRAGYLAASSPYPHMQRFDAWVRERRDRFERLFAGVHCGERVVGEWVLMAHGLRYFVVNPDDLFVAFDIMVGHERALPGIVEARCSDANIRGAHSYIAGTPTVCMSRFHAEGYAEGTVYRAIEDKVGKIRFLGKWVRPDFEAGRYLSTEHPIWNYPPHLIGADRRAA
jgi:hypothetical protein